MVLTSCPKSTCELGCSIAEHLFPSLHCILSYFFLLLNSMIAVLSAHTCCLATGSCISPILPWALLLVHETAALTRRRRRKDWHYFVFTPAISCCLQ